MKTFIKNKLVSAFTMIELVFVIVIVGILSAMIAPSFNGDNAREAADQIVSHIRYTQHLAMMDNKFDSSNKNWYKNRWNIDLNTTSYSISYEQYKKNGSNDGTKYASNPLASKQPLNPTGTKELNVADKYGITITNNCSVDKIFFDYIGRPLNGTSSPYGDILTSSCDINVSDGTQTITIRIKPETGYTYIVN